MKQDGEGKNVSSGQLQVSPDLRWGGVVQRPLERKSHLGVVPP